MRTGFHVEDLQLSNDLKTLPMIAKYDEALRTLLSQVFAGKVILAPSDRAFELYIGQVQEEIKFPFISLFPSGGYTEINQNYMQTNVGIPAYRQALLYNDDTLKYEGQSPTMQNFYQAMYFNIPYAIECWSSNRIQALQLVQELMFWLKAQREVLVSYKEILFKANLQVGSDIQDNSAYVSYPDLGNIYRFTIQIVIQAPVYRTANYLNITNTEFKLDLNEPLNNEKED